jgi:sarcosine oxidase subunit alpha
MEVNGIPNVNVSTFVVKDGMQVKSQNAYPSARRDFFSFLNYFDFILYGGFQYHWFKRPRFLIPLYQTIMRWLAGSGNLPLNIREPAKNQNAETIESDIAVIGGGPAGISAAIHAAKGGAKVILVDENSLLGGHLTTRTDFLSAILGEYKGLRCYEISERLRIDLEKFENIKLVSNALAFGFYPEGVIGVVNHNRISKLIPQKTIIATGAYERPLLFENNDLPGIYSGRMALQLVNGYLIKPGQRVVVVGGDRVSLATAYQLMEAGFKIEAIIEAGQTIDTAFDYADKLQNRGVKIFSSHVIDKAYGKKQVNAVTISKIDSSGKNVANSQKKLHCDFVCIACNLQPTYELCYQAKCKMSYSPYSGGFKPVHNQNMETSVAGLYVAGDAAGVKPVEIGMVEGKIAGISAGLSLEHSYKESEALRRELIHLANELKKENRKEQILAGEIIRGYKKSFVCTCEDVSVRDALRAIKDGFSDIEILKRYLGPGTGPCQGKHCLANLANILAGEKGQSDNEMRLPTQRPPIEPLPLSILRGDK